jgi:hypothetical protein
MINFKLAAAGDSVPPAPYSVFITPSFLTVKSSNGASTSPNATASTISGQAPFTYQWTSSNPEVTINSPTSRNTTFSASGFNREVESEVSVVVTDDNSAIASNTFSVVFFFGGAMSL